MNRLFIPLFYIILNCTVAFAQSIDEIKSSGKYLYGTGSDINSRRADEGALHALISQISTTIVSESDYWFKNTESDFKENFKLCMKSYSNMTLNFASKIEKETDDGYFVMRYLPKESINKLFAARADKVRSYAKLALDAETENRIGDALRYYYWAMVLLKSHPEYNEIKFQWDNKGEMLLDTWLPDRINRIFSLIDINTGIIAEQKDRTIVPIRFLFNKNNIRNIDYSYWTGSTWAKLIGTNNSSGLLEFYTEKSRIPEKVRLRIEYKYLSKCPLDKDVESIMNTIRLPKFKSAETEIILLEHKPEIDSLSLSDQNTYESIQVIHKLQQYIESNDEKGLDSLFTLDGLSIYKRLLKYGDAVFLPVDSPLEVLQLENERLVKTIPVKFHFPNNNKQFIEDLCFSINQDNLITNITFALNEQAVQGILKHSRWPENIKRELIMFMQNYKTAYALERIDYIENIFADNALIIVGREVKKAEPIEGMYKTLGNDKYEFIRKSKVEYIESLRTVFLSNEFVNIQFSTSQVKRRDSNSQVYGIQIEQDYYSSNYGDHGFLFLMIDMKDTLNPKIYIRSWQPEKNPDGTLIGLNDFKF